MDATERRARLAMAFAVVPARFGACGGGPCSGATPRRDMDGGGWAKTVCGPVADSYTQHTHSSLPPRGNTTLRSTRHASFVHAARHAMALLPLARLRQHARSGWQVDSDEAVRLVACPGRRGSDCSSAANEAERASRSQRTAASLPRSCGQQAVWEGPDPKLGGWPREKKTPSLSFMCA